MKKNKTFALEYILLYYYHYCLQLSSNKIQFIMFLEILSTTLREIKQIKCFTYE